MRSVIRGLANDNGSLRGLTGQGEPGLWTLLGGTGEELDASGYDLGGGAGQVSSTSRVARGTTERLVAFVAAGRMVPGGSTAPPIDPNPGQPGIPK